MQLYPVDDILRKHNKGVIKGPPLVDKLLSGQIYNRDERIFLVKVLAKYLMAKCLM
jgi:hypothetical protein